MGVGISGTGKNVLEFHKGSRTADDSQEYWAVICVAGQGLTGQLVTHPSFMHPFI
jgi:hypothetical protein